MTATPQQQNPIDRPRRWGLRWVVTVMVWVLIACRADESTSARPGGVTPFPTFTPTQTIAPTATPANVTTGMTATLTAAPLIASATLTTAEGEAIVGHLIAITSALTVSPALTIQPISTIPAALLTPTAQPALSPTATVALLSESTLYRVQTGDTLIAIAQRYQTTVAALKIANALPDDLIYPDQSLVIPSAAPPVALAPMSAPSTAAAAPLQNLSVLEGDLTTAYPLTIATERFTLHYAANPLPAQPPAVLADIIARALVHHEEMLQVTLSGRFDAYVAGAPFAPPDQSLRGHSYSADRFFVFLDDGSGNLDDLTYLIAHELTHMLVWLIFGRPTDPMLSEGAAVYVGMDFIAHAQHLPLTTFCTAYDQVNALPWISTKLTYKGHMRDLENYYAAGCFVKYLIETYGVEKFGQLYPSNDYIGIYGKTLAQLDAEWHAAFRATSRPVNFDAARFVQFVDRLKVAHAALFNTFTGTAEQMAQYRALDQVRMALLEGRLADVQLYFGQ